MNIRRVCCAYFTGTGNTKKAVRTVGRSAERVLDCPLEEYDFSLPPSREGELRFQEGDLAVVGVPVYAGRVPNVLLPFLTQKLRGGGALAVPVCTFGNRSFDDALAELRNILQSDGFHTVAAGAFAAEHAFSGTLGAGRPDGEDLALAARLGERAASLALDLAAPPPSPVPVEGEDPVRPYYTPRDRAGRPINILKVKPKTDPARCTGCGLCRRICTMGSIDAQDPSRISGVCIKCCACVKRCPGGAKYFDDPGYLLHRRELEEQYARRAESRLFF